MNAAKKRKRGPGLSRRATAIRLDVSTRMVTQLIKSGQLRTATLNGKERIIEASVEEVERAFELEAAE